MRYFTHIAVICFLMAVTFTWDMPTTNTDGSPTTDLAGARIYCGPASGNHALLVDVGLVTAYTSDTFADGTHYCVATAYDIAGNESVKSNELFFTLDRLAPGAVINFKLL